MAGLAGTDLGYTDYRTIAQSDIDTFADLTRDWNWMHVDREAAASGPFGSRIAHGFLSLALVGGFWPELFDVDDGSLKINYGLDRVRFIAPVHVSSRLRMHAQIDSAEPTRFGYRLHVGQTIEIEGEPKPALVAASIYEIRPPVPSDSVVAAGVATTG
jgi:acyl dehydratase